MSRIDTPSTPAPATATDDDRPGDHQLRRTVFWWVLALAATGVALAHLLEWKLSYRVGVDSSVIRHGSYGFTLARYAPTDPPRRTVVLLGNSVYQVCEIVPRMQRLADEGRKSLRLVNLAQTGAGIDDYLVQAGKVLRDRPDLLVVSLIPAAFDRALPPFRTDANLMAFDVGPLMHLPLGFYVSQFDHNALADAAVAALMPFPRLDPVLRATSRAPSLAPAWALRRLGFPTLNLTADWLAAPTQAHPEGFPSGRSYAGSGLLIHELVSMTRSAGVPLLLIWQEYQTAEPDLLPELQAEAVANAGYVSLVDLHRFWSANDYSDSVHPVESHRDAYAARHFNAVLQALTPPETRRTARP